jgi:hypothetical protein
MHADANITNIKVHASESLCTQMTAETLFRFATCTQPVFADDRRWHADFPVPGGEVTISILHASYPAAIATAYLYERRVSQYVRYRERRWLIFDGGDREARMRISKKDG